MVENQRIREIIDFRHDDGVNWYLVREKRTGEMIWVSEENIQEGLEGSLRRIREKKAIFAKSRVFGQKLAAKPARRVTISEQKDVEGSESADASSSDDSDSSSSSDELLRRGDARSTTGSVKLRTSQGSLANPSEETRVVVGSLTGMIGCRGLQVLHHLLQSDEDRKLNDIFVEILYGTKATGGVSAWHRQLLDLLWTGSIQEPVSEGRSAVLESLCALGHRMNSFDVVTARAFDEFVSEATNSFEEITSVNFGLFTKLCDVGIETRLKSLEALPRFEETPQADEIMAENAENGSAGISLSSQVKFFRFVSAGEEELDDAGIVDLVYKIYRMKNADKLADVPGIIDKYKVQLSTLFATLMKKYAVEYSSLGESRVFVPLEVKGKKLKSRLSEIFLTHEPSRLVDVDEIVGFCLTRPTSETGEYIARLEAGYKALYESSFFSTRTLEYTATAVESFGFRNLLAEALSVGNPDRLSELDSLLVKYRGKEHFAYLAICDKYNLSVNESAFVAADKRRSEYAESQRKDRMKGILQAVYAKHNPGKVSEVAKLAEKYNVWELFELIVKKYKISLAEKLEYLFSSGSVWAESETEFPPALKDSLKALALALELERISNGTIRSGTPCQFLQTLWNPVIACGPLLSAEMIIQAKSAVYHGHGPAGSTQAGGQLEAQLRDQVEHKVNQTLRKIGKDLLVRVTAQEPEYLAADSFAVNETGRLSCVVSLSGGDAEVVKSVLTNLSENFDQNGTDLPENEQQAILTGPGAFRAHSILRAENGAIMFVGDFRALIDSEAVNQSPSLHRSRLAVWASVSEDDCMRVVEKCMRLVRCTKKCTVCIDQHAQTVSVVGTHKHRTAFRETVRMMKNILHNSEPYLSLRIPRLLCQGGKPAMALAPQVYEWSDVSFHESGDDVDTTAEEPPSETARPLKLTRINMRDSYLQGQLCLNCDQTTHKPPECPIKRKVCWNCHGAHTGAACTYPCRFCKGKHSWGILECVKKGAKRFADWVKSRSFAEEKGLGAMVDAVIARLKSNGWNMTDPAVAGSIKSLAQLGVAVDLAVEIAKQDMMSDLTSAEIDASWDLKKLQPVLPAQTPPPLPDPKYAWMERVWLDELLSPTLIGRDPMRLLMAQKGTGLKQIEVRENCKILFRGSSAKEIFASSEQGSAGDTDMRFHALILCDSPLQALSVKQSLIELINQVETALEEGALARPQAVEAFSFLEKVPILNDNIAQFDFLNVNNGAPLELDLKDHFEYIGDLRHWLHQRGVEVELGDDNLVKLPGTGRIIQAVDETRKNNSAQMDQDHVSVFNAFFQLVSFWVNTPPVTGGQYWFEPFELKPEGLLGLAENFQENGNVFENGQVVSLSDIGVSHFARLLIQAELVVSCSNLDEKKIESVLSSFRGVVRAVARDVRLLMYLKHPWALSSSTGTVARDVPEDFSKVEAFKSVLNPKALRDCGRLATSVFRPLNTDPEILRRQLAPYESGDLDVASLVPGEGLLKRLSLDAVPETELPYTGYVVDWIAPQEVTDFVSGLSGPLEPVIEEEQVPHIPIVAALDQAPVEYPLDLDSVSEEDLAVIPVAQLKERLKAKGLPTTGRKADLIDRLHADSKQGESFPVTPKKTYKCRVELPKALMKWSELNNNLTGPNNSHFKHIKQQCPTATLVCLGSASAALVGDARLHVQLTATDPTDYRKAKSLAEDLVKAVAEVGADICLQDESPTIRAAALKEVRVVAIDEP